MTKSFPTLALSFLLLSGTAAFAQSADPQCLAKNSYGTETVDMAKCPDGKTVGSAAKSDTAAPAEAETTASTTSASSSLTLDPGVFTAGKIISANDFIGKTVYSAANENIGDVNDIILSDDGKVRGVILGVGGFLGIGEKNVAVDMNKINVVQDGNAIKLTVDATKEVLTSAPAYDSVKRTYVQ